jgi:hypothetical protein
MRQFLLAHPWVVFFLGWGAFLAIMLAPIFE